MVMENFRSASFAFIIAGCVIVASGLATAQAADPKRPCQPPQGASAHLHTTYGDLLSQWTALMGRLNSQRAMCSNVKSDQISLIQHCKQFGASIQSEWKKYNSNLSAHGAALQGKELRQIELRMAKVRDKLTRFSQSPNRHKKDFEAWAKLGTTAREEAFKAARDAIVSVALAHLGVKKQQAIQLTKHQRGSVKLMLKHYGPIFKYADKFSAQRLASLQTEAQLLKVLGNLHSSLTVAGKNFSPQDREQLMTGIVELLNLSVSNTHASLLLVDIGILTAASYGWTKGIVSRNRVNQLLALTEQELREVRSLTRLYERDVKIHNRLKAQGSSGSC